MKCTRCGYDDLGTGDTAHICEPNADAVKRFGPPLYTHQQLRDYGRAEYLRAISDAAEMCENMERNGAWITKEEAAKHIRALGSKT